MSEPTSQPLVVFSLGSEEYALPIGTDAEPRAVASDLPWIRGVIGLAGLAEHVLPLHEQGPAIAREAA